MKEIKLPSGAMLRIGTIPFGEAKALYQAILLEAKDLKISNTSEIAEILKNLICSGFSSKGIESALNICLKRCTYNDLRIEESTFEPISARSDYTTIWMEVVEEAITPFTSGLSAGLKRLSALMQNTQTPRP